MSRRKYLIQFATLVACLTSGACYKEASENIGEEETAIENAAIGEQEADDALDVVYQSEVFQKLHPGANVILNVCTTISNDTINHVLTVDFGTAPCLSFFGRTRTGKIISTYEGSLGDTIAKRTVTFENYTVNQKSVQGIVGLGNFFVTSSNKIVADRSVTDLKIIFPNGTGITFNGTESRLWKSGMGDTLEYNNAYVLSGQMSGVTSTGKAFTQKITKDVFINFFCAQSTYFARSVGTVELTHLDGFPDRTRTTDYGDSTCNNTVTVTTFQRTYGVTAN